VGGWRLFSFSVLEYPAETYKLWQQAIILLITVVLPMRLSAVVSDHTRQCRGEK